MSPAHLGSLVAALGLLAWTALAWRFEGAGRRRWLDGLLAAVLVLGVASYLNFGRFHGRGRLVHSHEQFHFFFGSKYLEELRYDGLYAGVSRAARERGLMRRRVPVRDLLSFEMVPPRAQDTLENAVRARFSDERWRAFGDDLVAFSRAWGNRFKRWLADHGNSGSPAWGALALPFTARLGPGPPGATLLGTLDFALLALFFGLAWRWVGFRPAAVGLLGMALQVHAWSYLGGSILRLDWLAALGIALAALASGRRRTAGLLLGYAIASKPFTAAFAIALGVHWVLRAAAERRLPREGVAVTLAAAVGLGLAVASGAASFGGLDIWVDYAERIAANLHEKYYSTQYSLRDVYLQAAVRGWRVLDPVPGGIAAANPRVFIEDHALGFGLLRLGAVGAVAWLSRRRSAAFAMGLGGLLVFSLVVVNMYYWGMLGLLGLAAVARMEPGGRRDPLAPVIVGFLAVFWAATHAVGAQDWIGRREGWFGSWLLAGGMLLVLAAEAGLRLRARRRSGPR